MDHQFDLVLSEDPVEDGAVQDRAGDLAVDLSPDCGIQRTDVERDDGPLWLERELIDQPVADLAARACDENDRFAHG